MPSHPPLASGILFPESILHSELFAVLAAFVAINTVMYSALAIAKLLPKLYAGDWFGPRSRRSETRSIYPDGPLPPRVTSPSVPGEGRDEDRGEQGSAGNSPAMAVGCPRLRLT